MSHAPPPLRCEIRRPPPELRWLKWSLLGVVLSASLLDVLWIIPAQRQALAESGRLEPGLQPAPYVDRRCHEDRADRERWVEGILLLQAPRR